VSHDVTVGLYGGVIGAGLQRRSGNVRQIPLRSCRSGEASRVSECQVPAVQVLVLGVQTTVTVWRDRLQLRADVCQRDLRQTRSALLLSVCDSLFKQTKV